MKRDWRMLQSKSGHGAGSLPDLATGHGKAAAVKFYRTDTWKIGFAALSLALSYSFAIIGR
jgi:hypothetical protein